MNSSQIVVQVLSFYGFFLIACGIVSVVFIGMKAKTALISGGTSGTLALVIAYFLSQNMFWAKIAGLVLATGLFVVFCWRTTKTLFRIFELIPLQDQELKGKGIAFLIIGLMAIATLIVLIFQIALF